MAASQPGAQPAFDSELDAIFSKTFAPPPKPVLPATAAKAAKSAKSREVGQQSDQSVKTALGKQHKPDKSLKKRKAPDPAPAESDPSDIDSEQEEIYAARAAAKRLRQSLGDQKSVLPSAKGLEKLKTKVQEEGQHSDADRESEDGASEGETSSEQGEEIQVPDPELSDDEQEYLSSASVSDMAPSTATARSQSPEPQPSTSASKQESREQQSDRTIFVGNVPLATALDRPARKLFTRFLQAKLLNLPKADGEEQHKVSSLRFRSLPLDVTGSKDKTTAHSDNHASKRGQQWKAQGYKKRKPDASTEEAETTLPGKVFLTTQQKRKVAYITGGQGKAKEGVAEAEKGGGSCTAYVVLSSPQPVAAFIAALDGAVFEGRTLRADLASRKHTDRNEERRTVFVGGIDVHESEESLRGWVESLLVEARGQADVKWVQRVRMVRDAATGLGKGFAYVLLHDADSVDELLAVDKAKLKLSKRKLRFERCKSTKMQALKKSGVPDKKSKGGDKGKREKAQGQERNQQRRPSTSAPVKPLNKADKEAYGKKLASLSKDDRKAAKSSDAERVARRLQKRDRKREEVKKAKKQEKQGNSMLKTLGKKLDNQGKNKVGGKSRVEKGAKKGKKTS